MRTALTLIAGAALLAGCGKPPADANNQAAVDNGAPLDVEEVPANEEPGAAEDLNMTGDTAATDAWVGKWVGVEGLALEIAKGATAGQYALKVSGMDGTGSFTGTGDGDVIRFTRDGTKETIRKATGDETGLKWLAGKKDCLMIKQAEGFCRD